MVGCVIARDGLQIGEGWHHRFGAPHAEAEALKSVSESAAGATMYVTLEPCCHQGKTPPCTDAVIAAGIQRVVVAQVDPFPAVAGQGIERLREAGLEVEVGLLKEEAIELCAPYRKLIQQQVPWIIAKWAMTLDGKLASRTGHSSWISNDTSRQRVHQLRRRVRRDLGRTGYGASGRSAVDGATGGPTHPDSDRGRFPGRIVVRQPPGSNLPAAAGLDRCVSASRLRPMPPTTAGWLRSACLSRRRTPRSAPRSAVGAGATADDQRAGRGRESAVGQFLRSGPD